jgi:hypothetical protein
MLKHTLIAAAFLGSIAAATGANAAGVAVGKLVCLSEGGVGAVFSSEKALSCTYTPLEGPTQVYSGKLEKVGIDLGITGKSVMVWDVLAKTGGNYPKYPLAGAYYGIGADASFAAGAGAKVLGGGTDKAFMLQPVNIQAQEGVNLALGVEKMTLAPSGI